MLGCLQPVQLFLGVSFPGAGGSVLTHRVCSALSLPGAVSALADDTDGKPFAANACPAPSCLLSYEVGVHTLQPNAHLKLPSACNFWDTVCTCACMNPWPGVALITALKAHGWNLVATNLKQGTYSKHAWQSLRCATHICMSNLHARSHTRLPQGWRLEACPPW